MNARLMAGVALLALAGCVTEDLPTRIDREMTTVVRECGVDGQPAIWTGPKACQFLYPPQFAFTNVAGAVAYRYDLVDGKGVKATMTAARPTAPLVPVWRTLTENASVTLTVTGVGKDGKDCGVAGTRTFWKLARFRPGTYPAPKRTYAEATARLYDYIFNLPSTKYLLANAKPDPDYNLNAYPAKMMTALIGAGVRYAQACPDRRDVALKLARYAADYLISISLPADAVLAHFPPTYDKPKPGHGLGGAGPSRQGQNMLIYPAEAGNAYLKLYDFTKEEKYLTAARRIGETYLKLQGEDGTCPLLVVEKTGVPTCRNRAFPLHIAELLGQLADLTDDDRFRQAAERGYAYIRRGPMTDWDWEGQFEDTSSNGKYSNLTKHPPCETAIVLLERNGDDEETVKFAREVLMFAEDQFVCWQVPCDEKGKGPRGIGGWDSNYKTWTCPSALEQWNCYVPIDGSASKMVNTYLAYWRVTGDELALAKAKALADSMVNIQMDSGRIQTFWCNDYRLDPLSDWVNCLIASAEALANIAEATGN